MEILHREERPARNSSPPRFPGSIVAYSNRVGHPADEQLRPRRLDVEVPRRGFIQIKPPQIRLTMRMELGETDYRNLARCGSSSKTTSRRSG
jgi:hypothetical protein